MSSGTPICVPARCTIMTGRHAFNHGEYLCDHCGGGKGFFPEASAHDLPSEPNWYWAVTDGRWKYIWYPEGAVEQLFDVDTDPNEATNLAGQPAHAAEQERLRAEMVRRHAARGSNAVEQGRMQTRPPLVEGDSERERRSRMWAGLHTEYLDHDVRH